MSNLSEHPLTRIYLEKVDQEQVTGDETEVNAPCLLPERDGEHGLTIWNPDTPQFHCHKCNLQGYLADIVDALSVKPQLSLVSAPNNDFSPPSAGMAKGRAATPKDESSAPPHKPRPSRGTGERIIITLLSLIFLCAGLAAAALSGFANYQAFSGSVTDALQSKVWGWTGVIASVISFGGFTFFYWHMANGRRGEGWRTALFALAGAATSIIGTQMYIDNSNLLAASAAEQAGSNRAVITAQVEDWRGQLAGIPPETRTVEGLEAYIAEVERVGRTHQKPYRDAQNELGLAKRRDDLESKIESANAQLIGVSDTGVVTSAPARRSIPSWFFAVMLELFSSQGTSIAAVALLILYGGRRNSEAVG